MAFRISPMVLPGTKPNGHLIMIFEDSLRTSSQNLNGMKCILCRFVCWLTVKLF